ncbi:MAG: hypothetical protein D8H95_44275 [Lachnospiraceae bacterium]|jgi:hypothetical protein|nr:MAG: hypothetical protein D8H95_44275 [Lachnospiraceae bacterium]
MGLGELLGSFKDELVKKAKRIEHEKEKAATMSDNEILNRLKCATGDEKLALMYEYRKRHKQ